MKLKPSGNSGLEGGGCGLGFGCRPDLGPCKPKPPLHTGSHHVGCGWSWCLRLEGHPPGGPLASGKCKTMLPPGLSGSHTVIDCSQPQATLGKPPPPTGDLPTNDTWSASKSVIKTCVPFSQKVLEILNSKCAPGQGSPPSTNRLRLAATLCLDQM